MFSTTQSARHMAKPTTPHQMGGSLLFPTSVRDLILCLVLHSQLGTWPNPRQRTCLELRGSFVIFEARGTHLLSTRTTAASAWLDSVMRSTDEKILKSTVKSLTGSMFFIAGCLVHFSRQLQKTSDQRQSPKP